MRWTVTRKLEVLNRLEIDGYDAMRDFIDYHGITPDELKEWANDPMVIELGMAWGAKKAA